MGWCACGYISLFSNNFYRKNKLSTWIQINSLSFIMQKLSLTCTGAYEALGNYRLNELENENEVTRVNLFNVSMPQFREVVKCFNDSKLGPQCNCWDCKETGLIKQYWTEETCDDCTLWCSWESLLENLEITIDSGLDTYHMDTMLHGDRGVRHLNVQTINTLESMILRAPPFVSRIGIRETKCVIINKQLEAFDFFKEDQDMRASPAAVLKWYGRWSQGVEVMATWGQPVRTMKDTRIAQWHRLWDAVRDRVSS